MNYQLHKLPEGFIVTSDKITREDANLTPHYQTPDSEFYKVIAQQDQIDFSGLSEEEQKEIGWFDVEKWATELLPDEDTNLHKLRKLDIALGFQKAQELLSDRMFDEESILGAIEIGFNLGRNFDEDNPNIGLSWLVHQKDNYIQSQKSWSIELEMEELVEDEAIIAIAFNDSLVKPKLTNGKIKITKIQ